MKYRTCPYCGAHLDPSEPCDCEEKEETAPGDAGAASKSVVVATDSAILTLRTPVVNDDCFRLGELQKLTGKQAKEISQEIAKRFPSFTRQIFSQCSSPEKYGCIVHPDVIRILRESYGIGPTDDAPMFPKLPDSEKPPTQCETVLKHIRVFGSITALEAQKAYGIMRLASRISDLRRLGYSFRVVTETGKNRYGESTSYARYFLLEAGAIAARPEPINIEKGL